MQIQVLENCGAEIQQYRPFFEDKSSSLCFSSPLFSMFYKTMHQPSIYNIFENEHMPFVFLLDKLRTQISVENNQ